MAAGASRPTLTIKEPNPGTDGLTGAIRVPTSQEIELLQRILEKNDRRVTIKLMEDGFNARVFDDETDGFKSFPPGYMVNIDEKSGEGEHGEKLYSRVQPKAARDSLHDVCLRVRINDPEIVAIKRTEDKNSKPNRGIFIGIETMGKLCAVAAELSPKR